MITSNSAMPSVDASINKGMIASLEVEHPIRVTELTSVVVDIPVAFIHNSFVAKRQLRILRIPPSYFNAALPIPVAPSILHS